MAAFSRVYRKMISYRGVFSVITLVPLLAYAALTVSVEPPAAAMTGSTYHVATNGLIRDILYGDAENGDKNLLDLYLPSGVSGKIPVVLWLHGGGMNVGSKEWAARGADAFLYAGYAFVGVNYRLNSQGDYYPLQIYDVKAAVRWLRANADAYGLDPDNIGVIGGSAGAFLAASLGTSGDIAELEGTVGDNLEYSSRVQAAVPMAGIYDFTNYFAWSVSQYLNNPDATCAQTQISYFLNCCLADGTGECYKNLVLCSAISGASPDDPPHMIMIGDQDATPHGIEDHTAFHEALLAQGVDSTLVIVPGAQHGDVFSMRTEQIIAFFDKHLKGSTVPTPEPTPTVNGNGNERYYGYTTWEPISSLPLEDLSTYVNFLQTKHVTGVKPTAEDLEALRGTGIKLILKLDEQHIIDGVNEEELRKLAAFIEPYRDVILAIYPINEPYKPENAWSEERLAGVVDQVRAIFPGYTIYNNFLSPYWAGSGDSFPNIPDNIDIIGFDAYHAPSVDQEQWYKDMIGNDIAIIKDRANGRPIIWSSLAFRIDHDGDGEPDSRPELYQAQWSYEICAAHNLAGLRWFFYEEKSATWYGASYWPDLIAKHREIGQNIIIPVTPTSTPTAMPTLTSTPTPNPNEIIIDDTDTGFSTSSFQDPWEEYTQTGGRHYGDSHYYNAQIGTGQDIAVWSFTLTKPGRYEVYAWWWDGNWRPTDVPYTINHLDGSATVRVNQQINGGQWNLLGTFDFQDQGSVVVSDDVSSGQDVAADAVRLVYIEPLPLPTPTLAPSATLTSTPTLSPTLPSVPSPTSTPTAMPTPTSTPTPNPNEVIIDNPDAGFSTSFSQDPWEEYTQTGGRHYGDSHFYNRHIGTGQDVAMWALWSFTVPKPGRYEVYAWWWEASWRPTDVPYTIDHRDGSTTVRVNQQTNGGLWNLLGTFDFQEQGSVMVSDDASSGQDVVADAVRLVYVEPLPPATPTSTPIANPTLTPTPSPTLVPSASPTFASTPSPTLAPTASPTSTPTPSPTSTGTASPTLTPTHTPTSTPTAMPTPTSTPTPNPNEIIIDDIDVGFSTSSSQDPWEKYTQTGGRLYGDSCYYNPQIGTGQDIAVWSFTVPKPGWYEVYAWWWEASWRPADVPYTINHKHGSTTVRVNQQTSGGQWNLLGTFHFLREGSIVVSDDASSGHHLVADAVRLVRRSPGPPKRE